MTRLRDRVSQLAGRRDVVAALVVALVAVVVVGLNFTWKQSCGGTVEGQYLDACYSDIPPLWGAERLDVGAVPYLDHPVEYPVLTGAQMWVAAGPADGSASFYAWTAALLALAAGVTGFALTREYGVGRGLVVAAAPTLLLSATVNWDLTSVAFATLGILAHRRGSDVKAGVWLGLGTAAKLWPGFALLALVPAAWAWRGRRAGLVTAGAAGGTWLAVNVPIMIVSFSSWSRFLELSRERLIDWDPTWALVTRWLGWNPSVDAVNLMSNGAFLVGAVAIVVVTARRATPDRWHHAALPILAWFLLTTKVYSPQFSLWLLPLMAITFPGWRLWAAFGAADVAVTFTRFPYLANFVGIGVVVPWWPFATALTVRFVIMAALAYVGWWTATAPSAATPGAAPTAPTPTPKARPLPASRTVM